jgi:cell wall-associated NlpC family hydrolase
MKLSFDLDPRRAAVVAEAETWLGTPYHHMGRVKGAGCDCLTMLAEVYCACGIIPHVDIPYFAPDFNLHQSAELYLEGLLQYAREIPGPPQPGDVALWKFGRCFAHGAIVMDWPTLIHSWVRIGVIYGDATQPTLAGRAVKFFDPF